MEAVANRLSIDRGICNGQNCCVSWVNLANRANSALGIWCYSALSLNRPSVAQIYEETADLRTNPLWQSHIKMKSTVRDLGSGIENALSLLDKTD